MKKMTTIACLMPIVCKLMGIKIDISIKSSPLESVTRKAKQTGIKKVTLFEGFEVKYYDFTLGALTLQPSDFFNVGV